MRYFIAKNGSTVVEKQALNGDDTKIDSLVDQYRISHPGLVVTEIDAVTFDATPFVADPVPLRNDAINQFLNDQSPIAKIFRGILLVLLDELNILRKRDRDRSIDVAAATTLADLKTRWAAESTLDDRTPAQGKSALQTKINAGTAD